MATHRIKLFKVTKLFRTKPCPKGHCTSAFSTSPQYQQDQSYELVILGGGTGGSAIANKFAPKLGKNRVAVIEPSEYHHYQPAFTLVGAGLKRFSATERRAEDVLPEGAVWIQDKVASLDPDNNRVITRKGDSISYDFAVICMGFQLNYHKIEGLLPALEEDPMVCSNYSPLYVRKTWNALQNIKEGNAIFTFPVEPIKCAGAPLKIAYLADDYFRKVSKRDDIEILYNASTATVFSIPRYSKALEGICHRRDIRLNMRQNLVKVDHKNRTATFELLDSDKGETEDYQYSMLHVPPPMSTPEALWGCPLVDHDNFVDVDKDTLRSTRYPNVFALGDCCNVPTKKTGAAVAAQVGVLSKNLSGLMKGKIPDKKYDGYSSCLLVTSYKTCMLAEFGYDGTILETFPVNQAQESRAMFHMKTFVMPNLYWKGLVKGRWHGPSLLRKILSPLKRKEE